MNESLRRALIRARLTEEGVAARLQVDPKTVRRWLEGRVPYLRHRWAVANLLGLDEADIWPQTGVSHPRDDEVVATYPHRDDMPRDFWRRLFSSAVTEISILDNSGLFLVQDPGMQSILEARGKSGVRVRICLHRPETVYVAAHSPPGTPADTPRARNLMSVCQCLRETGVVEVRLHKISLTSSIYQIDDELLIVQNAYGILSGQAPVLHIRGGRSTEMVTTYRESFERVWYTAT